MIELTLPWPSKDLSPNQRVHWARKAKAAKAARADAQLLARASGWHQMILPPGRLHLWLDFYPPTRRSVDDDNMLSRCKAYRDGIADALGIDDKRFVSHPWVKSEIRKGGQVVVRITGGPNADQDPVRPDDRRRAGQGRAGIQGRDTAGARTARRDSQRTEEAPPRGKQPRGEGA